MGLINSFRHAIRGIGYLLKSERNARIHLAVAVAVLTLGLVLRLTNAELAAIFFAIILVFLAEMTNTALEKTLDLIDTNHNQKIKLIKDMAAGAVFIAAVGAAIIGVAIFRDYILALLWRQ